MKNVIAIRKETKDKTQRRVPLSPAHIRQLVHKHDIKVIVEPWEHRVFKDEEYKKSGAILSSDLWESNIIFGVKEIAPEYMYDGKAHCFFSHTIKGQAYNMPMLQHILQRRITLLDYELVRNEEGKRLVFFGDFAGYAGMIDSLWALGKRLKSEGIRNPFTSIKYTTEYSSLEEAEDALREVGRRIRKDGLPKQFSPFVCAFTGYGRVSSAAQRLFDLLPVVELEPEELHKCFQTGRFSNRVVYKVKFQKPDMFHHRRKGAPFNAREFFTYPERYINKFERFIPYLSMIVNGIYWEPRFPKLVTKNAMKLLYKIQRVPRLRVIGDITCDVEGSIELTVKETDSTNPVFVYEPISGKVRDGWEGRGPVVLAVDKLPTELPREASEDFGNALLPFVPQLARTNFDRPFERLQLPQAFHQAVIAHDGKLAPVRKYLKNHLMKGLL